MREAIESSDTHNRTCPTTHACRKPHDRREARIRFAPSSCSRGSQNFAMAAHLYKTTSGSSNHQRSTSNWQLWCTLHVHFKVFFHIKCRRAKCLPVHWHQMLRGNAVGGACVSWKQASVRDTSAMSDAVVAQLWSAPSSTLSMSPSKSKSSRKGSTAPSAASSAPAAGASSWHQGKVTK